MPSSTSTCMGMRKELNISPLKGTLHMKLSRITSLMGIGLLMVSSALVAAPQATQAAESKDQTTVTSPEHRKHQMRGKNGKKRYMKHKAGKNGKKWHKKHRGEKQNYPEQNAPAPQE
jgi:hypothetical protein